MSWGAQLRRSGDAVVLALVLLGAPVVSALHNECDLCSPNCPMHHHQGTPNGSASHLGCHHAAASAARFGHSTPQANGPTVACATCGNHGLLSATGLPPMILPVASTLPTFDAPRPARVLLAGLNGRGSDPPDTPPPIGAA
jgi:hypothetical protein